MALDRDGSGLYFISSTNVITQLTPAQVSASVNEGTDSYVLSSSGGQLVVIFPELRDLAGYFMQNNDNTGRGASGGWNSIQVSTDTTNGLDGTWTTIATNVLIGQSNTTSPQYRTGITTTSQLGIKAIKGNINTGGNLTALHLYGSITSGQNPNRLALWHPTLDQQLTGAYFDWGDAKQGTSATNTFRVKNLSTTLTANTITLSLSALTDTSPTTVSQHTLSADGTTFASTASAGTLAPGTISGVMYVRRSLSNSATLSLWALRISAVASSWT
jgi:hypothetical protein